MTWLFLVAIDFPVSVGWLILSNFIDGNEILSRKDASGTYSTLRDIDNFWFPALYFGVIGSAWWYFIGWVLSKTFWAAGEVRDT
ncbi:hypothetical protein [Wenzhouxiangella sp. EGI_FJ10409]|uniref:hypothetical protein n=1 Tax=Wenzhouxiangella sp. EGI_FJ10409 TaxID=3243767 RepID=UPI0035D53C03